MSRKATIINGRIGTPRPDAESEAGALAIPHYANEGDIWNDGDPLNPDGTPHTDAEKRYVLPLPDFIRRFSDPELATLWTQSLTNPAFGVLVVRALGSTELDSDNPSVLAGKAAVAQVFGQTRADEIFGEP